MSDSKLKDPRLRWVFACGLGAVGFGNVANSVSRTVTDIAGMSSGWIAGLIAVGGFTIGGIMLAIAVAQDLLVRPEAQWMEWSDVWIPRFAAGAAGGVAGISLLAVWADAADPGGAVPAALAGGLAALGVVEWLMLRGRVSGAGGIVALTLAGLVCAALATAGVGYLWQGFAGSGLGGGVFGVVYTAVTGLRFRGGGQPTVLRQPGSQSPSNPNMNHTSILLLHASSTAPPPHSRTPRSAPPSSP